MKVISGTVIDGKVEVPSDSLSEGSRVMILTLEPEEPIHLTPAEEDELLEAVEQIRHGEFTDGQALLAELRSLRRD
jgi:hypothetical protein